MPFQVKKTLLRTLASCALLVSMCFANQAFGEVHAFFASTILAGEELKPISDAVLLVKDGRVLKVGKADGVDVPASAIRHELGQVTLVPGLVVAQTVLSGLSTNDPYSITPEVKAVDGFDPFGEYEDLLASGITCVQINPPGRKLLAGQGGVVRLGAEPGEQVLSDSESLLVNLNAAEFNPSTIYEPPVGAVSVDRPLEPTQPQLATSLSQAIVGLEALFAETMGAAEPNDVRLTELAALLRGKITMRWDVRNDAEARAALSLASQFKLPWIVVDPQEVEALKTEDVWKSALALGVVLNPELRPGRISNPNVPTADSRQPTPVWKRAKQLMDAGAAVALHATSDSDLEALLYTSRVFGRAGISNLDIIKMLTINPAKMLGVSQQVGSLAEGVHADFIALQGDPFGPESGNFLISNTYVGGEAVSAKIKRSSSENLSILIRAASVYLPTGEFAKASVSVQDGKIRGVGTGISSLPTATIHEYEGAYVVPGLLDCGVNLATGNATSSKLSFSTKLADLLVRDDRQVDLARQGGVTTALLSSSQLPSPVMAFKLTDEPRPLKDPVALRFQIRGNLTAAEASMRKTLAAGKAYADSWTQYDAKIVEYKKQLKEYETAKAKYDAAVKAAEEKRKKAEEAKKKESEKSGDSGQDEKKKEEASAAKDESPAKKPTDSSKDESSDSEADSKSAAAETGPQEPKKPEEPKKPRTSTSSEPYRALFAGKIPAMVDVGDTKSLQLAVKLFRKEFRLKTAIVSTSAAADNATSVAESEAFVVVGPSLVGESDGQLRNYPAELALQGVRFGFQSRASTGVKELATAISYATYRGLGQADALEALTTAPVEFFGLSKIGRIEQGYDADLVILSGPPTSLESEVLAVMIDGEWVYERE